MQAGTRVRVKKSKENDSLGYTGKEGVILSLTSSSQDPLVFDVRFEDSSRDEFLPYELEFLEDNHKEVTINPKDHSLVFVQQGTGRNWTVFQDGEEVVGLKSIDIVADIDYPTEHTIKYLTGATKPE